MERQPSSFAKHNLAVVKVRGVRAARRGGGPGGLEFLEVAYRLVSSTGMMVTDRRNRLKEDVTEAVECMKS